MPIDLNHVRFSIKNLKKEFGIIVHYNQHSIIILKGELEKVRGKFIYLVRNREALKPYIEHYFNHYVAA